MTNLPNMNGFSFPVYLLAATVSHLAVGLLSAAFPDSVAKSQPLKCPCRFLTRCWTGNNIEPGTESGGECLISLVCAYYLIMAGWLD